MKRPQVVIGGFTYTLTVTAAEWAEVGYRVLDAIWAENNPQHACHRECAIVGRTIPFAIA